MADNLHTLWCVDPFLVHADLICVRLLSRLVVVVLVVLRGWMCAGVAVGLAC
jgi:hypothetical protein